MRAAGSVRTLRVAASIGLVLAMACGGTKPGDDLAPGADATDEGRDAAADLADGFDVPDPARDTPDRDLPASPDDGIAPGDDSGVPEDPGSTDPAADPAPPDAPDDRDTDLAVDDGADPGPPCDPDAGPCPCATQDDCLAGAFCDGTACRPWICIPDARFCQGTTLLQCRVDGGGETIVEDCDDGDPCTLGDGCAGTRCRERTAVACDDGNPCTSDACDRTTGACVSAPVDGASCTDDDPCTANDRCRGGVCVAGGATPCSDQNPCTTDFCTSLLGCVHEPAAGSCTPSSDPCAAGRECRDAACQVVPRDCDDDDPCTLDACQTGGCVHTPVAGCACELGAGCDDGNACSQDACVGGRCVHEAAPGTGCCRDAADCDDGDPCTLDDCDGFRCTHTPAPLPACCSSPRLDVRFEDGTVGGFVLEPAGPDDVGWRRAAAPEGGGFVLAFSNAATTGYGTGARVAGSALSPPVTLPAGVALSITFRTWQDVESAPGQDPFRVDALSPDGTATQIWSRPEGFPMRAWRTVTANASALGGRTVRLRLAFDSLDGTANDGRGVFLDDIAVTSPCTAPGCGLESDCTSLDWHAACRDGVCDYTRVLDVVATPGVAASPVRFTGPSDVAVSPDGTRAYVSDRDAHRVQVLDADGNAGPIIGSYGTAPGRLVVPRGVAAGADRVYVADSGNHRIQAFSPAGTFLRSFGSKGDTPGRFNEPKGLALSDDGETLWVADTGNHRVQGLTRWGVVRVVIGSYGRNDGQFRSPSCVVPLPDGGIVVCDTQNNRLQRFTAGGRHLATIAATDGLPLSQPYGAARADGDALWVSDTYNHRIVLLDASGRTRDVYGQFGDGPGRFAYPLGMETDASGRLWIVDSGNRRVVVLRRGPVP